MTGPRYDTPAATAGGPGLPPRREVSDRLCGCGCGQYTLIATRSRTRDRTVRGEPLRYLQNHSGRRGRSRPSDRPCNPDTVFDCACCDTPTHPPNEGQRPCSAGHLPSTARNLCRVCYDAAGRDGTRDNYPRVLRTRDELLEEWEWMRGQGVGFREFAQRVGMTFTAWDRAYWRARAAGDPRAVRGHATKERCAA